MVSVHSLCTRFLQLKRITHKQQIRLQLWRIILCLFQQPCQLTQHSMGANHLLPEESVIYLLHQLPKGSPTLHTAPPHSFHCIHLSSPRDSLTINVLGFALTAQPKRKGFSVTFYNETKFKLRESIELELTAIAARDSFPGTRLLFTLPASVYFNPTFSSVSFVFGGGQTAWSRPGVLSSCSVGLWSGC